MAINDIELTKQNLGDLNKRIGEMEHKRGDEAYLFFNALLSDQLIFRRASGEVVGKFEPEGFLDSLKKPSPFTSRVSDHILRGSARRSRTGHADLHPPIGPMVPLGATATSDCSPDPETTGFLSWYNYEITSL